MGIQLTERVNTSLIAEFRTLDCSLGLFALDPIFLLTKNLILCQFVQKACVDELEKEIKD